MKIWHRVIWKKAIGLSVGLLLTSAALAGQSIDETHSVNANALITISNIKGKVSIVAGSTNEVRITGTLGNGVGELLVSGGGDRLEIEVRHPRNSRQIQATVLKLQVPKGSSVEVETVSADVVINNLQGDAIEVETISGDVEIEAESDRVQVTTVSGDIELKTRAGRTELATVSGDIDAIGMTGELNATTVSGDFSISTGALSRAHFESVSGDMEIDASLELQANLSISTLNGDIELFLPQNLSARCRVETFSGMIRSDRGKVREAEYGPHKSLSFRAGDGAGRIEIESFSGDVRIRSGVR